jgi:uncharacterized NAD(P)/FAD-binding protein YdhS
LPSEPHDFTEWLAADSGAPVNPDAFISRACFGRYVADRLEAARREARPHSTLLRHHAEALDVVREGERSVLHLSNATRLEADTVVLALGNAAPRRLPFFPRAGTDSAFYDSAWSPGALQVDDPDSEIMLIGSGLTAVDAFLALRANGHRGTVHMLSRRGLFPQAHVAGKQCPAQADSWKPGTLRDLLHEVRKRAAAAGQQGSNWRDVIASLRGVTNELWLGLSPRERERFLRHVKAYWDVHRHRMAPEVAAGIESARRDGKLRVHAGRVQRIQKVADGLRIEIQLRSQETAHLCAQRVINCTGSEQDYRRVGSQLLRSLFGKGWLAANPLGLGIQTAENGAVVDRKGAIMPRLYAIGPMRVGGLLETTAVPEIREQAASMAKTLLTDQAAIPTPKPFHREFVSQSLRASV